MNVQRIKLALALLTLTACGAMLTARGAAARGGSALDDELRAALDGHGFTGRVGQSLEQRPGRKVDDRLAELGRLAFRDSLLAPGDEESRQLLAFLSDGLLDPKARPENLRRLVPTRLPSGRPVHNFQQ